MSDASSWAEDLSSAGGALFDSILAGLPDVPQHLHLEALKAHLPTLPSVADMQSFEFPSFSSFPQVPDLPELSQQFHTFYAKLPSLPRLPDLSLPPLPDVDVSVAQAQLRAFYEENSVAVTYFGLWAASFVVVLALVSLLGPERPKAAQQQRRRRSSRGGRNVSFSDEAQLSDEEFVYEESTREPLADNGDTYEHDAPIFAFDRSFADDEGFGEDGDDQRPTSRTGVKLRPVLYSALKHQRVATPAVQPAPLSGNHDYSVYLSSSDDDDEEKAEDANDEGAQGDASDDVVLISSPVPNNEMSPAATVKKYDARKFGTVPRLKVPATSPRRLPVSASQRKAKLASGYASVARSVTRPASSATALDDDSPKSPPSAPSPRVLSMVDLGPSPVSSSGNRRREMASLASSFIDDSDEPSLPSPNEGSGSSSLSSSSSSASSAARLTPSASYADESGTVEVGQVPPAVEPPVPVAEEGKPAEAHEGEGDDNVSEEVAEGDTEVEEEDAPGGEDAGADEAVTKTPKKRAPGDEIPRGSTPTPAKRVRKQIVPDSETETDTTSEDTVSETTARRTTTPRRGRGRPKKVVKGRSTTKKVKTKDTATEDTASETTATSVTGTPRRGRGRPKRSTSDAVPRGAKPTPAKKTKGAEKVDDAEEEEVDTFAVAKTPVKLPYAFRKATAAAYLRDQGVTATPLDDEEAAAGAAADTTTTKKKRTLREATTAAEEVTAADTAAVEKSGRVSKKQK